MKGRTRQNIMLGLKVLAICGATVFAFNGIRSTYKCARLEGSREETEQTMLDIGRIGTSEEKKPYVAEYQTEETEETNHSADCGMTWDADEAYLLAKIAMAEAEGEDTEGKALVILVVLNRVQSEAFPGTIQEVIYQKNQFSPVANGRLDKVEPNEDCYKALDLVRLEQWDDSEGALYFESKSQSEWHRRNLKFLFQRGSHYFYADKE